MRDPTANQDATVTALQALAWTLSETGRAERLLALTGLMPDELRAAAGASSTLVAVLDFLASHEPDLVACAAALDMTPAALIAVRDRLETA